jgi:glycosyltransferase involved in cell wall biosynthesis
MVVDLGLTGQVRFAPELFQTLFSLSDAYARATACTYFSSHEGFGNVIVESILARRPLFVNNYEPVFADDIGSKGIHTVMIEHGNLTDEAVDAMARVIYDPGLAAEITEHNYELGRKYFSYDTLREKLSFLIELACRAAGVNP